MGRRIKELSDMTRVLSTSELHRGSVDLCSKKFYNSLTDKCSAITTLESYGISNTRLLNVEERGYLAQVMGESANALTFEARRRLFKNKCCSIIMLNYQNYKLQFIKDIIANKGIEVSGKLSMRELEYIAYVLSPIVPIDIIKYDLHKEIFKDLNKTLIVNR